MKKIIIFLAILTALILFTSCSTQQRIVYRDCNCNTTTFGWGNTPYWGWNTWSWYPYRTIPPYYVRPYRVQPSPPTRYERKTSIGNRPSRNTQNQSDRFDNVYPTRTPSIVNRQSQQRSTQPSRVQSTPSRTRSTPNRYSQPQQRVSQPRSTVSGNPTTPTRSRTQNKEN